MNLFLACVGVSTLVMCMFILSAIHDEMERIRKALNKKQKVNPTIVRWEPIETDGYAGEPQGKEHAP